MMKQNQIGTVALCQQSGYRRFGFVSRAEYSIPLCFEVRNSFIKIIHIHTHTQEPFFERICRKMGMHNIDAPFFLVFQNYIIQKFDLWSMLN